jgi:hypothetical protein
MMESFSPFSRYALTRPSRPLACRRTPLTDRSRGTGLQWLAVMALLASLWLGVSPLSAQPARADDLPQLDAGTRAAIIDSITTAILDVYIFADKADSMDRLLRDNLKSGAYATITSPIEFTGKLTEDLRSVCHDKHLRVGVEPPRPETAPEMTDEQRRAEFIARSRADNFGFRKIERLPGNIGYLKFNQFAAAEYAGATAVAALNFLANVDALIIDLRENGGGSPSSIQLITSYFFAEPTHLNSFYIRRTDQTKQFWTQAHVEGPRLVDVPLYVLTSRSTFSGAEEFTYNLKNLERATIIGETTGGGAHPVEGHTFDFEGFVVTMALPFGRAVNPITGTNWEGTGVEPDIQVPAAEALLTAQIEALKALQERKTGESERQALAWARQGIEVQLHPVTLSSSQLKAYAGTYGPRRIWHEDGSLWYQREDRPKFRLIPMGDDTFLIEELDYFRLKFAKDEKGRVTQVIGMYDNGFQDAHDRTGNA